MVSTVCCPSGTRKREEIAEIVCMIILLQIACLDQNQCGEETQRIANHLETSRSSAEPKTRWMRISAGAS
jgi:hypothetical protein